MGAMTEAGPENGGPPGLLWRAALPSRVLLALNLGCCAYAGHDQHPELVAELRKSVHAALVGKSKGTSTAAYTK